MKFKEKILFFLRPVFGRNMPTLHKLIENFPLQTESGKVNSIPEGKLQTGCRTG